MDLPPELFGYLDNSAKLRKFDAGIDGILRRALGPDWIARGRKAADEVLTPRQRGWRELRYFYETSMGNSGDLFSYLHVVYDHRELFEEIGAQKTLKAAEDLRSLYDQYAALPSYQEKGDFWHQTREQRASIEQEAEGMSEFAELLIRFAEAHPEDFPQQQAKDPFSSMLEVLDKLRREDAGGSQRERDLASGLFEAVSATLRKGANDQDESR